MPTLAYSNEFLEAYARLPRAQQKKVREFTDKFQANPKSSAINYEKIHGVKDDKVRTVRIDKQYRAVILHPEQGDVYVLVWVDNHDEAMDWASKKSFSINPKTGALQVVNLENVKQVIPPKPSSKNATLFTKFDDATLVSFGIPEALLPAIRAVSNHDQLLAVNKHLPDEAAEALLWLAEDMPVEEIRAAVAKPAIVDTSDLAAALENPDTKRRFVTVTSQEDLTRILDAPLEKWRIFLHPSQENLVRKNFNGPARVLGLAGTGKTVVAMHRARHLAKNVFTQEKDRILFTTFTGNLARNVEQNLKSLCGEEFKRIDVTHLHSWAAKYMSDQGKKFTIANNEEIQNCWEKAALESKNVEWDVGFLQQEWDQVVQANGITNKQEYLKVSRTGRGQTVTRAQRVLLWNLFERFQAHLRSLSKHEWIELIRQARQHLEKNRGKLPYRSVVVDESQDFHSEEWRLIRAIVPEQANDLFLVGDAHQRIYGRKVTLGRCGIKIQGRSHKLKINYRTTEQIRSWAVVMLDDTEFDDLDGGRDDQRDYRSLLSGSAPDVRSFASAEEESKFLGQCLQELLENHQPNEICLVARTLALVNRYVPLLNKLKIRHLLLNKSADESASGIRLATMHRVKGLEFPCMIVTSINADKVPIRLRTAASDPIAKEEHEIRERSLLFVAATRARDRLIVTAWGKPSPFIVKLLEGSAT